MTGPTSRRAPDAATVLVHLDAGARIPLHRQVYDGVRDAILGRRLLPGARLPSTRALAADLGVARNTVALAFDQLRAEGYIDGRRGGGTRVRSALPETFLHVRPNARVGAAAGARPGSVPARRPAAAKAVLSVRGLALARGLSATGQAAPGTPARPFRLGVPAIDAFPTKLWARLTARRWRQGGVHLADADPGGDSALRAAIAAHAGNARGVRCTPDQVLVVNGTQQAIDLVVRLLVDAGDAAWLEDPGYFDARALLADAGARLVPVRVDDEGLDVAAGERAAPDARLAYVTPSHQFPLGRVMSARRRLALLDWASRASAWILEDDYDSEFRYTGRPLPCLQGLEAARRGASPARVLYVGTFSKSLVPGFRLAYLIIPDELVEAFRVARAAIDRHAPTLAQGVLADFIGEGHYARHVRRVRALYAGRQQALLAAAERELGGLLSLSPDAAGLHLVGWLPPGMDDVEAARTAAAAGVEATPLSRYYLTAPARGRRDALLLGYAGFDERAIGAAVRKLRRPLEALNRP